MVTYKDEGKYIENDGVSDGAVDVEVSFQDRMDNQTFQTNSVKGIVVVTRERSLA